ncbi:transglycosylase domain-containing protein [Chitinophaga sp. YR627]|uniref:transglycosylase domain-containing protein n=1 Tax=Chitinophaga sp. YR627 TaxID=1881041 RepID=UPI0015A722C4|nr:transglycosylase domain-containing protein [Chitinophaga sp. YR627]
MSALENPGSVQSSEIITEDGVVLSKYYKTDRSYTDYEAISVHLTNALLATEDRHFYDHTGVRSVDMMGMFMYPLIGKWKHGYGTISMQLSRRLLINNGARYGTGNAFDDIDTFLKIEESLLTIKLERHFTKQEIIALYLNTARFGGEIYGIENAARVFFSKDPGHLSLEEAAMLIGMLKGNRLYNPYRNPKVAPLRRNTVLQLMRKYDFITQAEAAEAEVRPILLRHSKIEYNKGYNLYFRDVLRESLEKWCNAHKAPDGSPYNLYEDGLKVYTTINAATTTGDFIANPIYITCIKDRYGNILQTFTKRTNDSSPKAHQP